MKKFCSFARLFAKLPQPREREVAFFWSSSQSHTCHYLPNHTKVKASHQGPCPRTQQANLLVCFPHYPFNAIFKQENREYQTFRTFGPARRELNPGLPTASHGRRRGIFVWPFFGLFFCWSPLKEA